MIQESLHDRTAMRIGIKLLFVKKKQQPNLFIFLLHIILLFQKLSFKSKYLSPINFYLFASLFLDPYILSGFLSKHLVRLFSFAPSRESKLAESVREKLDLKCHKYLNRAF